MSDYENSDQEDEVYSAGSSETSAFDTKRHARAQHNALERRRRDNIKDMYGALKDAIPGMKDERASRAAILKKSIDLITRKQNELERAVAENRRLEEENAKLEQEIERYSREVSTMQEREKSEPLANTSASTSSVVMPAELDIHAASSDKASS